MKFFNSINTFSWLLWADIRFFLNDALNHIINASCWPLVIILVNAYITPVMGMPADWGVFITISMLIIMMSFGSWDKGRELVIDIEGPRTISYDLVLPLQAWLVYCKIIVSCALQATLFNLMSLIIGKLLLFQLFDLSQFSIGRFLLIYGIESLFFAAFAIWAAVFSGSSHRFFQIEIRVSGPLFFLCGHAFPWFVLYNTVPTFGLLMLVTPWIYAYEGTRAAIVGQAGYINYWICIGMLVFFFALFFAHGLYLFKKRLDCI